MGAPGLSAAAAGHESPLCYRAGGRLSAQLVFSWGAGPTAEPFLPTHVLREVGAADRGPDGHRLRWRAPGGQHLAGAWPASEDQAVDSVSQRHAKAPPLLGGLCGLARGLCPLYLVSFLLSCSGLPSPEAPWRLRTHAPRPRLAVSSTSRFSLRSLGERRSRDRKNVLSALWGGRGRGSGPCTCR